MTADIPTITSCCYGTSTSDTSNLWVGDAGTAVDKKLQDLDDASWAARHRQIERVLQESFNPQPPTPKKTMTRIVRIYIADPDENLPVSNRLLFQSEEKLTEATDQELYFEVPIMDLLAKHNTFRTTQVDKKATEKLGKQVLLEPVRIRDLKMTIVTVAQF